ncbi:MAG: hypothetical protein JNM90_13185 [Burkholderiales bacterium]|nr:hypothetical protein [Burkholderiales bacterium]
MTRVLAAAMLTGVLASAAQAASVTVTDSGTVSQSYYYPTDWNNPASANHPRMQFELPGALLGANIGSATLSFTGQLYGSGPTAAVEMIRAPGPNQTVASDVVYPFNYGQFASVDVVAAVNAWTGAGVPRLANLGLLIRLDSGFADLPTGAFYLESYRPTLTVTYTATAASARAGMIATAGQSVLGQSWSFDDIAVLQSLYLAGGGTAVVDGETWSYTAAEYSTAGPWGGPREIGDAWIDAGGHKHIYLGSGLTTAPVPEPAIVLQLLAGLGVLASLRAARRRAS